jgi:hypothetical protein
LKCIALTNAFLLTEHLSRSLIGAGLDVLRVSVVRYDRETYRRWMGKDAHNHVREQIRGFLRVRNELAGTTDVTLYHLITDLDRANHEIEMYRKNWIEDLGCPGEIWMMHNWGGEYTDIPYERSRGVRRSCGRPHAPQLTVRAGGEDGHTGAVVPCCLVLGQESRAILGHLDEESIADVVAGPRYEALRKLYEDGDFDSIDYCRACDQLYDAPESLVWSNIPGKEYGQSKYLQDLDFRDWARQPDTD